MMLPLVAGLGALLLANPLRRGKRRRRRNPIRGGKRRAKAHARQLRRVVRAARAFESRTGSNFGRFGAFKWALKSQCRAGHYGIKQARIVAAAKRGTRQKKRNPYIVDPFTGRKVRRKPIRVRMGGPTKTRRGGIAGVRGADGVWRRPNPQRKPTLYRLADGDVVTAAQLRRMFMGKIPGPAHRRLLGIRKA